MKKEEYLKLIKKKPKYGNKEVRYDGHLFKSKAERARYKELKLMEKAGLIEQLELQVPHLLRPSKKGVRPIKYIADFTYYEVDALKPIVEDVKGKTAPLTEAFKLKRKLFKEVFGFDITIVRR